MCMIVVILLYRIFVMFCCYCAIAQRTLQNIPKQTAHNVHRTQTPSFSETIFAVAFSRIRSRFARLSLAGLPSIVQNLPKRKKKILPHMYFGVAVFHRLWCMLNNPKQSETSNFIANRHTENMDQNK